jgi:flagellar motor switch protein FliG
MKYDNDRAKALAAMLNAKQMRDLVARIGVLDGKSPEEVKEMDAMDVKEKAEKLAKWLHEFVEANVEKFCKPIQK